MSDKEIRVHVRDMLIEEASFRELELHELEDGEDKLVRGSPAFAHGRIDFEVKDGEERRRYRPRGEGEGWRLSFGSA